MRLSAKQRAALEAVAAGRVVYGDPYPQMLARRIERAQRRAAAGETEGGMLGRDTRPVVTNPAALAHPDFLVDGTQVHGAEHTTYRSLGERGWVDAYLNDDGTARTVTLTEAGHAALGRAAFNTEESK